MENYQNLINEALGGGTPKECYNNLMDILQKRLTNKSDLKGTSFHDLQDTFFGKKGTPERDAYEAEYQKYLTYTKKK